MVDTESRQVRKAPGGRDAFGGGLFGYDDPEADRVVVA